MKKYYFICEFYEKLFKDYSLVADVGSTLEEMYDYANQYAKKENLKLDGKKKGSIFKDGIEIGKFIIESKAIG